MNGAPSRLDHLGPDSWTFIQKLVLRNSAKFSQLIFAGFRENIVKSDKIPQSTANMTIAI